MVLAAAGSVPAAGTRLSVGPFEVEVLEADERSIARVRLRRRSTGDEP